MDILGFIVKVCYSFYNGIYAIGSVVINGFYNTDLFADNIFSELMTNMGIEPLQIPELVIRPDLNGLSSIQSIVEWFTLFINQSPLLAIMSFAFYVGIIFLVIRLLSRLTRSIKDLFNPLN